MSPVDAHQGHEKSLVISFMNTFATTRFLAVEGIPAAVCAKNHEPHLSHHLERPSPSVDRRC